jgi:hypothetical protein
MGGWVFSVIPVIGYPGFWLWGIVILASLYHKKYNTQHKYYNIWRPFIVHINILDKCREKVDSLKR